MPTSHLLRLGMRVSAEENLRRTALPGVRHRRGFAGAAAKAAGRRGGVEAQAPRVKAPPSHFDFRKETLAATEALVAKVHPELRQLKETGVLVAIPRPSTYVERRKDGYKEPELVILIGTVHLSPVSVDAVRQTIKHVRPDNVVVELCRTRSGALYALDASEGSLGADTAASMRLSSLRKAVKATLDGNGSLAGLALRLVADNLSGRMQVQAGVRSGGEMRAARLAAEEVGSQLVLGDRPIEISLERAWDALSSRQKWQLAWRLLILLFRPLPVLDPKDVEDLDSEDVIEAMTRKLTEDYPEVATAFLHERDLYLAWSLKRSKAVNGCKTVVGVVGRGHLRGVVWHLKQESSNLRFRDLAGPRARQKLPGKIPRWVTVLAVNLVLVAGFKALWQTARQHRDVLL